MKKIITFALSVFFLMQVYAFPVNEYYQILVYHFATAEQEKMVDGYLQNAFLPFMHKNGVQNIGVFSPVANDTTTDKKIYVFLTLQSPNQIADWNAKMLKDKIGEINSGDYWKAAHTSPPYTRLESILIHAWVMAPTMNLPKLKSPKTDHVYELRSYESANDRLYWNKVNMFNEGGEVELFAKLNFNAVFYGDVIAGNRMPNLMYMTSFENMADRDAKWKEFVNAPEWKKLSSLEEYKNNVSKADIILMKGKAYSDF